MSRVSSLQPDVVLVEKGVSRLAQELLLEQGVSLVVNVDLPELDRISRCTGARSVTNTKQTCRLRP